MRMLGNMLVNEVIKVQTAGEGVRVDVRMCPGNLAVRSTRSLPLIPM